MTSLHSGAIDQTGSPSEAVGEPASFKRHAPAQPSPNWPRDTRRRTLLILGFSMLFVSSSQRKLFETRVMLKDAVTTAARRSDADGDLHAAGYPRLEEASAMLPWLEWERHALVNGSCHAPTNVPNRCCVGASSAGGEVFVSPECLAKGPEPYERVKARAADFLRQHPVPPASSRRLVLSSHAPTEPTDCDTCRIVDQLLAYNYTLTFQGDSVTRQVFTGLECDLLRRGYILNSTTEHHPHAEGLGWRYGLSETRTLRITAPHRTAGGHSEPREATLIFRAMYRPIHDMQQVAMIADATDIFVFDHGLHYEPQDVDAMSEFANSTASILATVRKSTRTQLVALKETTPQHYNTTGGHWTGFGSECVPITEGHEGVRRAMVEQAARNAGYARVVDATEISTAGYKTLRGRDERALVVLPYRDFLVPFHDLHGGECTHYCSSPYIYVPLWRSLRLALDAYLS